jgi:hypothetical protein
MFQRFKTQCVLILGVYFGTPMKFSHFDVIPITKHRIHYIKTMVVFPFQI